MATLTVPTKNTATLTFYLRHGKEPTIGDIQNLTFNDIVYPDGKQIKDLTFNDLANATYILENKVSATLTLPTKN